ncbi:MAG: phosphate signaling complex protein PhoU [Desulfobacterales bacterium]|nr:phosphate signaling complex protein PhoU [Desulfobacterales bacterium]
MTYLQKELEKVKRDILSLGAIVEDRFQKSAQAVRANDTKLALSVIEKDIEIDTREIEIEEECLKLLALYQPVAVDLRSIIVAIKINNDLERIGDLSSNISQRLLAASKNLPCGYNYDYSFMVEQTGKMFKMSLDSLVTMNIDTAYEALLMDEKINLMRDEAFIEMKKAIKGNPGNVSDIINMYLISRHIERIGDHITNIAEEVIHLVEGEIIRHKNKEYSNIYK